MSGKHHPTDEITPLTSLQADSLRGTPSTKEELPAAAASQLADDIATDTAAAVRLSTKPKQESAEEATTRTSSSTSSIFEVFPEQDTVEARLHFSFHNVPYKKTCQKTRMSVFGEFRCATRVTRPVGPRSTAPVDCSPPSTSTISSPTPRRSSIGRSR